jgi:hypothetical protein
MTRSKVRSKKWLELSAHRLLLVNSQLRQISIIGSAAAETHLALRIMAAQQHLRMSISTTQMPLNDYSVVASDESGH